MKGLSSAQRRRAVEGPQQMGRARSTRLPSPPPSKKLSGAGRPQCEATTLPHTPHPPAAKGSVLTVRERREFGRRAEEREGVQAAGMNLVCKVLTLPQVPGPKGPRRQLYSHFVRQPRVGRQRDLKGNLRPKEESGRVKVGQRAKVGAADKPALTWWS